MDKRLLEQFQLYLPVVGILLLVGGLIVTVVLQSRHSDIAVADQKLLGRQVTIDKVFLTSNGFVAVHESDAQGNLMPSSPIGHTHLESGLNFNVEVRLSRPVTSGTKLFAVVHRDTGQLQRFEFAEGATAKDPIERVNGKPVASKFSIE